MVCFYIWSWLLLYSNIVIINTGKLLNSIWNIFIYEDIVCERMWLME